jgi:flavorubredoxin
MKPVEVKKDVYWVGAVDWDVRDFHGYSTKKGTTYNAYLLNDEKKVLFDTVKHGFGGDLIHRIYNLMKPEDIDYLVINHLEPDHSGSLEEIVERVKPEKIFTSTMGVKSMRGYYHKKVDEWPIEIVKSGDTLETGSKTISFLETRMVHWPDSMFSYIPQDKLLISSDGFGMHWATSERFDDEVEFNELMYHSAKYYANILLLYAPLLKKLLATVQEMGLEIDCIAPDHGLIWRKNPGAILEAYQRWSNQETCSKALVIYDTMWHSTEQMAKAVHDGLMDAGVSAQLLNLGMNHRSDVITETLDAKALIFGSPTLNNGMLPRMADLLTYMRGLKPLNKYAAAFGSYGWSGEAVKHINQYLEDMKFDIVHPGMRGLYKPDHDMLKECRELGEMVGNKVQESFAASCGAHP